MHARAEYARGGIELRPAFLPPRRLGRLDVYQEVARSSHPKALDHQARARSPTTDCYRPREQEMPGHAVTRSSRGRASLLSPWRE